MKFRYCALAIATTTILAGCNSDSENPAKGNNGQAYKEPIASSVTIAGDALVGSTLSGKYTFTDPNYTPRAESSSIFNWKVADNDDEPSNDVSVGSEQTLTLSDTELGKNVYFCVTPVANGNAATTGKEKCSASQQVQSGNGEKPQASDVAIDNTSPTVGDTLTGSYNYSDPDSDPEATSQFVWKRGGSDIAGQTSKTITLSALDEGNTIQFCVTPVSTNPDALPNYPVTGDQACSIATNIVQPKAGSAPVASNVTTSGDHSVGAQLTGNYTFQDNDNDLEGASTFSWKRNGTAISGENTTKYTATSDDKGKSLEFCVTPTAQTGLPKTGNEACATPITDISDPVGDIPKVTLDPISSDADISTPQVGNTLTGSYQYQQTSSGAADESLAVWKADNATITGTTCVTGQSCNLIISDSELGKAITYCVTPKAADSSAGTESCSAPLTTFGVRLTGKLEFNQTLTAQVFGFQNPTYSWKVDTSNTNGPAGDLSRTEKSTQSSYTVGATVLNNITAGFEKDSGNNNGVIDDADWDQAVRLGNLTSATENAAHYIGKDVELCVTTTESGEICLLASQQPKSAVTGGVVYDSNAPEKRAIEPVREVPFLNSIYHRPLSFAETLAASNTEFGANLPKAHYKQTVAGIDWSLFKLEHTDRTAPAVESCVKLYDAAPTWHLPASRADSSYTPNAYADRGNNPPLDNNNALLIKLANIFNKNTNAAANGLIGNYNGNVSPIFGWPTNSDVNTPFWSATKPKSNDAQANSVKFYDGGTSGNNSVGNGRFVTCVKSAG